MVNSTVNGLDTLAVTLGKLANLEPNKALPAIGEAFVKRAQLGFNRAADPYGTAWRPLAPSTIQQKGHSRPLILTGSMRNRFNSIVRGDAVAIGTTPDYAPFHQDGTPRIPARQMLPWRDAAGGVELPESWLLEAIEHVEKALDI
jgi:phage gpG-like protein